MEQLALLWQGTGIAQLTLEQGIMVLVREGDTVNAGDTLVTIG